MELQANNNQQVTILDAQATDFGFVFSSGERQAGKLRIVEDLGGAVATRLLMGFKVYFGNTLIADENFVGQKMGYARNKVCNMIEDSTVRGLEEYCERRNRPFDKGKARAMVRQSLDLSYFANEEPLGELLDSWGV
ncbi:hypothetical protein [Persicobacter psychrovividus]|uniref:Uncharacterized protein n=1 Tax=Persicobacter psychrovividus TaxID=387638 RepID=A0ABN6LKW2_9BACT|nr:hypothetical protein PEPS_43620 [Persicobacter psychrovividus]